VGCRSVLRLTRRARGDFPHASCLSLRGALAEVTTQKSTSITLQQLNERL
jgi:hypothetical protein